MDYDNITILECEKRYGLYGSRVLINDGKVIDIEKDNEQKINLHQTGSRLIFKATLL